MKTKKKNSITHLITPTDDNISYGWLDKTMAFALRSASEASFKVLSHPPGGKDVNFHFIAILVVISENPGINQKILSQTIRRDRSTLTATLTTLEGLKFITRERGSADKRSYTIAITDIGQSEIKRWKARALEHEKILKRLVGPSHFEEVLEAMERIVLILKI